MAELHRSSNDSDLSAAKSAAGISRVRQCEGHRTRWSCSRTVLAIRKIRALSIAEFVICCSPFLESSCESSEAVTIKSEVKSIAYENRTKSAESGGLERNGPRERKSGLTPHVAVRRFVPEVPRYWASSHTRTSQRILIAEGLAERKELKSNPLRAPGGRWMDANERAVR